VGFLVASLVYFVAALRRNASGTRAIKDNGERRP